MKYIIVFAVVYGIIRTVLGVIADAIEEKMEARK